MNGIRLASMPHVASPTVLALISTHSVGGPGKGLIQLATSLSRRGDMRILVCVFRHARKRDTDFIRAAQEQGVELRVLEQRFNFDWRAFDQLKRIIRDENVDIVQTHGYKEDVFGLLLKRALRKPWICFLHGTTEENIKVRAYHALDRLVVRVADRIVSVSHELANRTVPARKRSKVTVVENSVSPEGPAPTPFQVAAWRRRYGVARGNVIGCVGRLSPEKGQDILIEAAARLRDANVRGQVLLVGDGPMRITLARQVVSLGLTNHVVFAGTQQDMAPVYDAMDVLVLPSRKEGMPNVVLEAMQHGLPIVATRVGAIPEMLRDGQDALLVEAGNARSLANALRSVLCDKPRAQRLGAAAREAVFPRYSPERRANEMEKIYRELCGSGT